MNTEFDWEYVEELIWCNHLSNTDCDLFSFFEQNRIMFNF